MPSPILDNIELLNIAIASAITGVTISDACQPDMPLIYVNPGFESITGYSANDVIGCNCRFLQGKETDQPGLTVLRAAIRKGQSCTVRLRNYRKDGGLFHNELHLSPVHDREGTLTHFIGIQLDVTDRVRAHESLKRSERQTRLALQREAELNEIKSRFISMVSHEFRTPMTGIRTSAALLRRFAKAPEDERTTRHYANIESSLKRMNRLLEDVLFFSKAEANKVEVIREAVDIASYLNQFIENLQLIHPERTIEMDNKLASSSVFQLDVHLLDHIFHNLIGNGLKYSAVDAPVRCCLAEVDGMLELSVSDTGIGIPEADQGHLFEAFHRADNVGARSGTGLGLNIARRAAELLGGSISFSSSVEQGSTFRVVIPLNQVNT